MENQLGLSTFVLAFPFSDNEGPAFDRVAAMGYELIEVCVEDPTLLTAQALNAHVARTGLPVSICGAFGPDRDVSARGPARRRQGIDYLKPCIDIAPPSDPPRGRPDVLRHRQSPAAVPRGTPAAAPVGSRRLRVVADYAAERGVTLAIEPLNRFETDLVNTVEQGLELCEDSAATT